MRHCRVEAISNNYDGWCIEIEQMQKYTFVMTKIKEIILFNLELSKEIFITIVLERSNKHK